MIYHLDDLVNRFYDLMDEGQGQNYINKALAQQYVNNAVALLYNFIADASPWFYHAEKIYTPIIGQVDLDLPADFRTCLKAYAQITSLSSTLQYVPLQTFESDTYTMFHNSFRFSGVNQALPRYRIMGNVLRLDPAPQTSPIGYNVVMWYIPQAPVLVDGADIRDIFPTIAGWEQWIVNQAVIYAKIKEEVSFTDLAALNADIKNQITRNLAVRDMGTNDRILDTEGLVGSIPNGHAWH